MIKLTSIKNKLRSLANPIKYSASATLHVNGFSSKQCLLALSTFSPISFLKECTLPT